MRMGEWWNDTDRGTRKYLKWKPVISTTIAVIMNWVWNSKVQSTEGWAGVAQSVLRLATGWMFRGSGRWGRDFLHPSRLALYDWYCVFLEDKAAGAWRWSPTPPSAGVKESVKVYIYFPSGPSWLVLGWPVALPFLPSRSTLGCAQFNHKNYKRGLLW
jgi:hypothetical protein